MPGRCHGSPSSSRARSPRLLALVLALAVLAACGPLGGGSPVAAPGNPTEAPLWREWTRALDSSLGRPPRGQTWSDLALQGRRRFRREASMMYLVARPDNPLDLTRPERMRCLRLLQALERETARTAWSRLKVASVLEDLGPFGEPPPELRRLPRSVFLRAAPALLRRLQSLGRGIPLAPDRPEVDERQGPPDSSGEIPPAWLVLHRVRQAVDARNLSARQAARLATEVENCQGALKATQECWVELEEVFQARPHRLFVLQRALAESTLPLFLLSENDVASHGSIFLVRALGLQDPQEYPFGHPAQHLALCGVCLEAYGGPAQAWVRSLGVDPAWFRSTRGTLRVFQGLEGESRQRAFTLVGPPALETEGPRGRTWTYVVDGHEVTLRLSPQDRILSVDVPPGG